MTTGTQALKTMRAAYAKPWGDTNPMTRTERRNELAFCRAAAAVPYAEIKTKADAIAVLDAVDDLGYEYEPEDWETLLGQLRSYIVKAAVT